MINGPSMMRWVLGYEGLYLVHRDGYVVNRLAKRMAIKIDRYGYATVRLNRAGEQKCKKVHRLICEAWRGPAPSPEHHAAHLDGRKLNNVPENVVWATPGENERHKIGHGTSNLKWSGMPGSANPMAKLTDAQVSEIRGAAGSMRTLGRVFGVSAATICRIKNGHQRGEAVTPTPNPEQNQ